MGSGALAFFRALYSTQGEYKRTREVGHANRLRVPAPDPSITASRTYKGLVSHEAQNFCSRTLRKTRRAYARNVVMGTTHTVAMKRNANSRNRGSRHTPTPTCIGCRSANMRCQQASPYIAIEPFVFVPSSRYNNCRDLPTSSSLHPARTSLWLECLDARSS